MNDPGELFERYHTMVLAMTLRMTRSRPVAEDITAETFARAVAHAHETWNDPRAWLTTVATNLVIGWSRRHSTRREVLTDPQALPHGHDLDPALVVGRRLDHDQLRAAIRRLPGRQRECVVRRYWGDETEAMTVAAMGVARGTVKSTTSRGLANLRVLLETDTKGTPPWVRTPGSSSKPTRKAG